MNTTKKAAETRTFAVSFWGKLATDERLTGTPTVVEVQTSALTISNIAVTTLERPIDGLTLDAGRAVEFSVSGGVSRTDYTVRITAVSDGTPAQTLVEDIRIEVR